MQDFSTRSFFISCLIINIIYIYFLQEIISSLLILSFMVCLFVFMLGKNTGWWLKVLVFITCVAGHYYSYGWKINPEASVNFLLGVVGLKFLEVKKIRDLYMILMSQILLFCAGFLFVKDLDYVFYTFISTFVLMIKIMRIEKIKTHYLQLIKCILLGVPAFILLFIIFPRWNHGLLSFEKSIPKAENKKIKLPENLVFSQFNSLLPNDEENFIAWLAPTQAENLYWKSHALTDTDGWSWFVDPILELQNFVISKPNKLVISTLPAHPSATFSPTKGSSSIIQNNEENNILVHQTILFAQKPKYFVLLDTPLHVKIMNNYYDFSLYEGNILYPINATTKAYEGQSVLRSQVSADHSGADNQWDIFPSSNIYSKNKIKKLRTSVNASSKTSEFKLSKAKWSSLTKHRLNSQIVAWMNKEFGHQKKGIDVLQTTINIKNYFKKNNFTYDSSIKKILNISDFIKSKKGTSDHYASFVSLALRALDIPTRLWVGYLGGNFNKIGNYYSIKSNHVHFWLEAWSDQSGWIRIDPSRWVTHRDYYESGFFNGQEQNNNFWAMFSNNSFINIAFISNTLLMLKNMNAQFYFWMEGYNQSEQFKLADYFKLNLTQFYQRGAVILLVFFLLFYLLLFQYKLYQKRTRFNWNEWCKFWNEFLQDYSHFSIPWGKLENALVILEKEQQLLLQDSKSRNNNKKLKKNNYWYNKLKRIQKIISQ